MAVLTKNQVTANNYDLSATRYAEIAEEDTFFDKPAVTLERLCRLGV